MNIVIDCERMKYPNTGLYTFGDKFSQVPKKNFHVLPLILKNNDYELIIAGIT